METFYTLLDICEGSPLAIGGASHNAGFDVSSIKRLQKKSSAGDLIRHGGHCDVIVMKWHYSWWPGRIWGVSRVNTWDNTIHVPIVSFIADVIEISQLPALQAPTR